MTPKSLIEPARHAGTALLRSQSDARLVDLTRDGNERAFEAIVHRYRRPLLRYCSRLLPLARAEDAVQQAFVSAHRAIHAGDNELNLQPWLYRIAHNASLNLLRQHGFDHEQVSEQIDGVETPPQAFERGERLRTVVAAVQELPERQRSALLLQAVDGRSYDEIAAELGVTDGAVRQLLNRARNTLREAAAALTPTGLITRIAADGSEAGVGDRIAAAMAGAGSSALVAKAGTALVVAGAVAGGAVSGGLPGTGAGHHDSRAASRDTAQVAPAAPSTTSGHRENVARIIGHGPAGTRAGRSSDGRSHSHAGGTAGDRHGSSGGGGGERSGDSGSRDGSGSGDGGSGHGGDGSSGDRSGSTSGSDDGGSSGSGTSGSSGSSSGDGGGSDGSGSSGSGSDGGSSGSGTSDASGTSDTSGSSGSSGTSGSDDLYIAPAPIGDSSGSGKTDATSSTDGTSGRH